MFSQSFKLNQVRQQKLFQIHYGSKFKAKIFMFLIWTSKLRHLGLDFGIFNCIFEFLTIQNLLICTSFYDIYTPICQVINHLSMAVNFEITSVWCKKAIMGQISNACNLETINNCKLKLDNFVCPIGSCKWCKILKEIWDGGCRTFLICTIFIWNYP